MTVVDTSVWVAFFRGRDRMLVEHLRLLLDEDRVALAKPVRLELLGGVRHREHARLADLLDALPPLVPSISTWAQAEAWVARAVRAGHRYGLVDLLIAALAAERGADVWSLDTDFRRMATAGWIALHPTPA